MIGIDIALGATLGAILGSAGGALVTRWPDGRQMRDGRSRCDACHAPVPALALMPIAGWLMVGGRCRRCGARIDPAQPLLEAMLALAGALIGWWWRPFDALALEQALAGAGGGADADGALAATITTVAGIAALAGAWLLAVLAVLDWRHHWLPDRLTWPFLALGLVAGEWVTGAPLIDRLVGAVAVAALALALAAAFRARRGVDGLGLGDVKLMAGIAAWAGWQAMPLIVALGAGLGLLHALIARDPAARYPFGTHLAAASGIIALISLY